MGDAGMAGAALATNNIPTEKMEAKIPLQPLRWLVFDHIFLKSSQ